MLLEYCSFLVAPAIAALISYLVYSIVKKFFYNDELTRYFGEFAGTFVSSVCVCEMEIIANVYGKYTFFYTFAFLHIYCKMIYFIKTLLHGSPLVFIDLFYVYNRKHVYTTLQTVLVLVTQIFASLSGIAYSRIIWRHVDATHMSAIGNLCNVSLSPSYTWWYAAVFEGLGVFTCVVIDMNTPAKWKAFVRTTLILTLNHNFGYISGMWMNPMLATTHTFRCRGHVSDWQHFAVYWFAPAFGIFLAYEINQVLKSFNGSTIKKNK